MNRQARRLVLHADDLGMSRAVNRGILLGFRDGLLTSAAILANAPEAEDAMTLWNALSADRRAGRLPSAAARRRLGEIDRPFDLGVHLNLSQGRPLGKDYPGELLDSDGRFPGATGLFFRLLRYGRKHREAITAELERLVRFVVDRGPRPTHLNGHQYVEMMPGMAPVTAPLLDQFQLPMVRVAVARGLWRTTALRGVFRRVARRASRFAAIVPLFRSRAIGLLVGNRPASGPSRVRPPGRRRLVRPVGRPAPPRIGLAAFKRLARAHRAPWPDAGAAQSGMTGAGA